MEDISSTPRPRSPGVVVLDAVTALGRPFRMGKLPASQRLAIGIGAGIMLIGAVVLTVGARWEPPVPAGTPRHAAAGDRPPAIPGGGTGSPVQSTTTPGASSSAGFSPSVTATSGSATQPAATGPARNGAGATPQPLQARYAKVAGSETLAGYRATVTISNPGPVAADSWTVTITLPRETLTMSNVAGATTDRNRATWTLQPTTATATVPANGSVSVSFQVNGAAVLDATPTACTIDGQLCAGLAGR
jgi:hypothetical protein